MIIDSKIRLGREDMIQEKNINKSENNKNLYGNLELQNPGYEKKWMRLSLRSLSSYLTQVLKIKRSNL